MLRFGEMQIPTKSTASENRLADLCAIRPDSDLVGREPGNAELRPNDPPPEPVRAICGKNWALATPISALAAIRILLGFANVRTTRNQR